MPPPPSSPEPVEEDEEMDEEEMDFDGDMVDPMEMLGSFLATEDGDTIATALVSLKDSTEKIALNMEMQNKILVKILSALTKTSQCCGKCATPSEAA
jgi:hypothetical protein